MGKLSQIMAIKPPDVPMGMSRPDFETLHAGALQFHKSCTDLGLGMCAASAARLIVVLDRVAAVLANNPNESGVQIGNAESIPMQGYMAEIANRIKDELGSRLMLVIPTENAAQYEQLEPPFGKDFAGKFPSAQYDLAEAGKCLALSRSTAAVFHLMRVIEVGLAAVHGCLGISVPLIGNDRNWGNILTRIRDNISARGNKWSEKDEFQELYALLTAVKDAWRNATMHIENKYTDEEAKQIFDLAKGFMMKLSARMDEGGTPQA